jgi:hypothetical protein
MNDSISIPLSGLAAVPDRKRRRFLQAGVAATSAVLAQPLLSGSALAALPPLEMTQTAPDSVPRKPLGKTGE